MEIIATLGELLSSVVVPASWKMIQVVERTRVWFCRHLWGGGHGQDSRIEWLQRLKERPFSFVFFTIGKFHFWTRKKNGNWRWEDECKKPHMVWAPCPLLLPHLIPFLGPCGSSYFEGIWRVSFELNSM